MSAFFAAFQTEIRSRVTLVFWVGLTLFLALTGPFGTYAPFSFLQRLGVLVPLMLAVMAMGTAIRALVFSVLPTPDFRRAAFITAVLASLILAPLLDRFLWVVSSGSAVGHPGLGELVLLLASLSLGLSSLRRPVSPARDRAADLPPDPAPLLQSQARLMRRLEADLRGELWAISVRDHYVDVQTSAGAASLLMRLGDAMAEASPVEGAQVHRSHWVAWAAVETVERDGARLFLRLRHGQNVPVSKNHRSKLEERGLL